MVLPDRFIDQASPTEMYRDAGMSEGDIIARCIELLSKSSSKSDQQVGKINIQSS
jgi:1-deoxy-D-xylulose-5-phosphate synthase